MMLTGKVDRSGGIINAIFGFLFVAVFRAALAVVLTPIQVIVNVCQSKPLARWVRRKRRVQLRGRGRREWRDDRVGRAEIGGQVWLFNLR
jgi:hypothetical protein